MKILIITNLYAPDECGGATIFTDLAETLASRGHVVTVRTTYPYYPEWKDKSGENGFHVGRETRNGVWVERYGMRVPQDPSSLTGRLTYEASWLMSLARSTRKGCFDVAIIFCPLMGSVAFGMINRILRGVPTILCVQDRPVSAAVQAGILKSPTVAKVADAVEHAMFSTFDAIRTINETMAREIPGACVIPDWLPEGLSTKLGRPLDREWLGHDGTVRLLYSGNVAGKQGLAEFCTRLARCSAPFRFRINGAGPGLASVYEATAGDDRFTIGDLTDDVEFAERMRSSDLFVITEKPGTTAPFFPSKSICAMTAGTPILAVCDARSPLGTEVRDHGLGIHLEWWDATRLDKVIADVSRSDLRGWHDACRHRSGYYSRPICIDRFEVLLRCITKS